MLAFSLSIRVIKGSMPAEFIEQNCSKSLENNNLVVGRSSMFVESLMILRTSESRFDNIYDRSWKRENQVQLIRAVLLIAQSQDYIRKGAP